MEGAKVLVSSLSFKENCPDIRNTKIIDVVTELKEYQIDVDLYDLWVVVQEAEQEHEIRPVHSVSENSYDAIILAMSHEQFKQMGEAQIRALDKPSQVLYDLKYVLNAKEADIRL